MAAEGLITFDELGAKLEVIEEKRECADGNSRLSKTIGRACEVPRGTRMPS